MTHHLKLLVAV
jgi:hypothetical protein